MKSLEAAEAVRRNEEKKEKERKMKKEASKLEKLRLDQEKVKQREINEKKKEEERKKELELNARKRQREEDQKNDVKKKKFRCLQEKSRQYKQQNKMHVEDKGLQHNATVSTILTFIIQFNGVPLSLFVMHRNSTLFTDHYAYKRTLRGNITCGYWLYLIGFGEDVHHNMVQQFFPTMTDHNLKL